jgi:hypothetical protein
MRPGQMKSRLKKSELQSRRNLSRIYPAVSPQSRRDRKLSVFVQARVATLLLLLGAMFSCSQEAMLSRFADSPETKLALSCVELLQRGDGASLIARLPEKLRTPDSEKTVAQMVEIVPRQRELDHKLVGYHWNLVNGVRQVDVVIEYHYPTTYLLADVVVSGAPPNLQLEGMHVQQTEGSQLARPVFRVKGQSPRYLGFLALAIAIPVFILTVLVICLRSAIPRTEKMIWIVLIVLGVGKVSLNWSTGQFGITPLAVQLLGASAFAQGPAWVLAISLPLGAASFLWRRRRLERGSARSDVTPSGI